MESETTNCQNCEQPYKRGFSFCPHCGQKSNEHLTIGVLFYNTISNYFSFDARFLKSFFPLIFRPGYLAVKFISGKRLLYLHPAQMYLFVSVVFFFILSFSTRELVVKADELNEKVAKTGTTSDSLLVEKTNLKNIELDSLEAQNVMKHLKNNQHTLKMKDEDLATVDSIIHPKGKLSKSYKSSWDFSKKKIDSLVTSGASDDAIYKEMGMADDAGFFEKRFFASMLNLIKGHGAGSIVQAIFDTIPIAMFFLLPFFALILKLFYFKKGKYVHHLVFSFYFFSFLFAVFSFIFGVNRFIYDIPDVIDWFIALGTFIYFFLALKRFYQQHWFLSFIKSGVITFIFLLMVTPLTAGLVVAFSVLFY